MICVFYIEGLFNKVYLVFIEVCDVFFDIYW